MPRRANSVPRPLECLTLPSRGVAGADCVAVADRVAARLRAAADRTVVVPPCCTPAAAVAGRMAAVAAELVPSAVPHRTAAVVGGMVAAAAVVDNRTVAAAKDTVRISAVAVGFRRSQVSRSSVAAGAARFRRAAQRIRAVLERSRIQT